MHKAVRVRSDSRPQALFSGEILPGDRGLLFLYFFQGEITGKELDTETGYYYFGARYLDPKTSRWISADPAMGDYVPFAPVNDEARKRNGNLPGQGGVFNYVNLHVYHYAGNNPVKYVDPDGGNFKYIDEYEQAKQNQKLLGERLTYTDVGLPVNGPCLMRALEGVAESFIGRNLTSDELSKLNKSLTSGENPIVDVKEEYEVQNTKSVIEKTLKILDPDNKYKVTIVKPDDANYDKIKNKAIGSLLGTGNHWQEGDHNGYFKWDGHRGLTNKYVGKITEVRYVSIEKVPNKTRDMLDPNRF